MLHPDTEHYVLLSFVRERCEQTQGHKLRLATKSTTATRLARLLAAGGDLFITMGTQMKLRANSTKTTMPAGIVEAK